MGERVGVVCSVKSCFFVVLVTTVDNRVRDYEEAVNDSTKLQGEVHQVCHFDG